MTQHKDRFYQVNLRQVVCAGLLLAIGVVLPQLFHAVGGPTMGKIFLPLHIAVLMAGLLLGPMLGLLVGILLPVASFLASGMPAPPALFFMLFELAAYGFFTGLFYQKLPLVPSLILAMLAGRAVNALALLAGVGLLGIPYPGLGTGALLPAVLGTVAGVAVTGLPGILLQLIVIPVLVTALKRSGVLYGRD
ncbi:MAG TPA: ECF transporter S component [Firmicutes bacterium]|nr:ECF transporter S component [Bacillota bacterium]